MKHLQPKLRTTVHYNDQEAPPELRERAICAYNQCLIDLYLQDQEQKNAKGLPIERFENDIEDW